MEKLVYMHLIQLLKWKKLKHTGNVWSGFLNKNKSVLNLYESWLDMNCYEALLYRWYVSIRSYGALSMQYGTWKVITIFWYMNGIWCYGIGIMTFFAVNPLYLIINKNHKKRLQYVE